MKPHNQLNKLTNFERYCNSFCYQKVKYSGSKPYDQKFTHRGYGNATKLKAYTVKNLVPGTNYTFEVYGTSACGNSSSAFLSVETTIAGNHL